MGHSNGRLQNNMLGGGECEGDDLVAVALALAALADHLPLIACFVLSLTAGLRWMSRQW